MKGILTSKERILLALDGKPADHIPFSPFLVYAWEHFPKKIQNMGLLEFHRMIGADPLWRGAPCPVKNIYSEKIITEKIIEGDLDRYRTTTPVGVLSYAYAHSEAGNTNFLVEHPLKREEDYYIQIWIEENTACATDMESVQNHFAGNGQDGLSLGMLIPRGKSAFQSLVEHHCGTEELAYAMADFPETVEELLNVMVQKDMEAVEIAASVPEYEYFITWEDSSTQNYSPGQYEKYIAGEIRRWCGVLSKNGKRYVQHACGHLKDILRPMKDSGVYAVESISSPPTGNITLAESRKIAGNDFGIIGGIEPTVFLNMNLKELESYVIDIVRDGKAGPFVLANSDSCPPGVSVEKFKLVSETVAKIKL